MNHIEFHHFFEDFKQCLNNQVKSYPPQSLANPSFLENEERYKILLLESYRIREKFATNSAIYPALQLLISVCEMRAKQIIHNSRNNVEDPILNLKTQFRDLVYFIMTNGEQIEKNYVLYMHQLLQ